MSPALSQHPLCSSSQDPNPSTVYPLLHLPLNPHPPLTPQQSPQLLTLLGVWGHLFHEGNKVFQEFGVVIRQVEVFAILSGVWGTRFVVRGDGKGKVSSAPGMARQALAVLPAPRLDRDTKVVTCHLSWECHPVRSTGCGHLCRLPGIQPLPPAVPLSLPPPARGLAPVLFHMGPGGTGAGTAVLREKGSPDPYKAIRTRNAQLRKARNRRSIT